MSGSIFLSYAGIDRETAATVVERLETAGLNVWWDQGQDGVGWGDNWIDKLQETLINCSAYIIIVGSSGVRRWVKAELSIAIRRHFESNLPVFPLLLSNVEPEHLPPFLSIFQAEQLPENPDQFDFGELASQLAHAVSFKGYNKHPGIKSGVCPFPGLDAFSEDEAPFFFGRQSETLDALRFLGPGLDGVYRRWLQVEGPSGVGKSSLVRAGLIPAIKRGWIDEGRRDVISGWNVAAPFRPGANGLENLAEALTKSRIELNARSLSTLYEELKEGPPTALRHLLREGVADGDNFVLVIDQFEEIFTLSMNMEDRTRFDRLVAEALQDFDGPLHLVSTVRSDSMLRFGELPRLHELLNQSAGRYLLPPISEVGLRDVVQTPMRLAGLRWSDASLPGEIIEEAIAEPGALPLVGNLLRLLWDERVDDVLDASIYRRKGGLGAALADRADLLIESLGRDGRERARGLLLALVEPGRESQDSRRTISRATALAAAGGGASAEEVLDRLSGLRRSSTPHGAMATPRLIVLSGEQSDQEQEVGFRVDLAHEALLRDDRRGNPYWKTLRNWVEAHRKQLEDRHLLEILAEKWQDSGSVWHSVELARGRQLKEFLQARTAASDLARSYLRASQLFRWIRWSALVGLIVPASVGLSFAYWINNLGVGAWEGARVLGVNIGWTSMAVPEMVNLPSGEFHMGSSEKRGSYDERPQQEITVPGFAIGKYEVTFSDWDTCFAAGGCSRLPNDDGWGRGSRPVINVSWEEAKSYVNWLAKLTGDGYRLPSEAEWEYAARAGTTSLYSFGDKITKDQANFLSGQTTEVGSFSANAWGLHDMHGNVWEWVEDCWNDDYRGAPTDGSAWLQGDCSLRGLRGGSWYVVPVSLRSANRGKFDGIGASRINSFGFRVARTNPQ